MNLRNENNPGPQDYPILPSQPHGCEHVFAFEEDPGVEQR